MYLLPGTSGEPFTANVTTGISIADVRKDNIAVYFGCVVSPVRGMFLKRRSHYMIMQVTICKISNSKEVEYEYISRASIR